MCGNGPCTHEIICSFLFENILLCFFSSSKLWERGLQGLTSLFLSNEHVLMAKAHHSRQRRRDLRPALRSLRVRKWPSPVRLRVDSPGSSLVGTGYQVLSVNTHRSRRKSQTHTCENRVSLTHRRFNRQAAKATDTPRHENGLRHVHVSSLSPSRLTGHWTY